MEKKRRAVRLLLAAVLILGLFPPVPASAATLYFTAVNNSVADIGHHALLVRGNPLCALQHF